MREINRVKDALEWCNRALEMIREPDRDDDFKFVYANAALIIIRSKLTREIEEQSEPEYQDPVHAALDEALKIR